MKVRGEYSDREIEILQLLSQGAADKEVARQLHLSLNTVKWHNRQIYSKLGVTNRTQAVAQAEKLGLLGEEGVLSHPGVSRVPNNLPAPVSSFVGRAKEMEEINNLLKDHRLVTLTGPGGVGKTRLALEVANNLVAAGQFPDGIYFVELTPIHDSGAVDEVVLESLGLPQEGTKPADERLEFYLREKNIMLVFDNFEHLLAAAPRVNKILEESPGLTVLATSREPLQLSGEQCYQIYPLPIQPSQQLFIQRAQQVNPDFEPAEDDLSVIERICSEVDRLPLAIELAAARTNVLSLPDLLRQMESRFALLIDAPRDVPERHQTLQKTIDWSYQLLSDEEQELFSRVSVFEGSYTIDAVAEICCYDLTLNALDGLSSLLNKNLIKKDQGLDREIRFSLLETINDYARNSLSSSGREKTVRDKHAFYYYRLAREVKDHQEMRAETNAWRLRLSSEVNNLRSMIQWAIESGNEQIGLMAIGCLHPFSGFFIRREWEGWMVWAMQNVHKVDVLDQINIYTGAGRLAYQNNDLASSKEYYQQVLNLCSKLESIRGMAWAHCHLMEAYMISPDDRSELIHHFQKATELFEILNDSIGEAYTLSAYGIAESVLGNYEESNAAFQKALIIGQENKDVSLEAISLTNLSCNLFDEGKSQQSYAHALRAIKIILEERSPFSHGNRIKCLADISGPLAALGKPLRSVVILGAVDSLCAKLCIPYHPEEEIDIQKYHEYAKQMLNEDDYLSAWEEGQRMSFEEAVAFALKDPGQAG